MQRLFALQTYVVFLSQGFTNTIGVAVRTAQIILVDTGQFHI